MTVETPVEKVLEFVDDPENLAQCAPMVKRIVEAPRTGERVGNSFRVTYRLLGMPFNEEFRVIGFEPPRRYTPHRRFQIWQTFHGRVRGTLTWTLEAETNQTYASLDAGYRLVGGVFGRALDALLVERAVKRDVDRMLENMKRLLAPQTMSTQVARLGSTGQDREAQLGPFVLARAGVREHQPDADDKPGFS